MVPRDRGQTVKGRDTGTHAHTCTGSCLSTTQSHTGSHRHGHTHMHTHMCMHAHARTYTWGEGRICKVQLCLSHTHTYTHRDKHSNQMHTHAQQGQTLMNTDSTLTHKLSETQTHRLQEAFHSQRFCRAPSSGCSWAPGPRPP